MEAQGATLGSQSTESCSLDLPTACYRSGYNALQRPSQEAQSEARSSVEPHSLFCSSDVDPDSSNPNTEQKGSWDSENFWLDPSVKGPLETKEEDNGIRKSLDKFYEAFGHPVLGSGDRLSVSVCQCLSQKITELRDQESQKYARLSFQMARVIFSRDGCSVLRRRSRNTCFYPLEQGGSSVENEKLTPGLSREIIHFLLQQPVMKDF
ncbi:shieldin complex subunit 1 [Nannospalax galili]|nr:shieldin complex subunit 1 [Nannospalax galili]